MNTEEKRVYDLAIAMIQAVTADDVAKLEELIKAGAPVNFSTDGNFMNGGKVDVTLLIGAVLQRKIEVVKCLLANGADVFGQCSLGLTAIQWAYGRYESADDQYKKAKYGELVEILMKAIARTAGCESSLVTSNALSTFA